MTKCPGHAILGKKVPRNPKQRTLFPVTFFQGFDKIQTFSKFLFPGFFSPETFFLGTFLHRFNGQNYKMFKVIKYPKLQLFYSIYTVFMFIWPGLGHYWRGLEHRDIFAMSLNSDLPSNLQLSYKMYRNKKRSKLYKMSKCFRPFTKCFALINNILYHSIN